jgi:hypothetical protein
MNAACRYAECRGTDKKELFFSLFEVHHDT